MGRIDAQSCRMMRLYLFRAPRFIDRLVAMDTLLDDTVSISVSIVTSNDSADPLHRSMVKNP